MKNFTVHTAAIIALTLVTSSAIAQADIDTDGDGLLSYNELLAAYPTMTEEGFIAMDTNSDGAVDADEIKLASEAGLLPTEG